MTKDLLGKALLDYQNRNYTEDIVTWTNISDEDVLPVPYLFRRFNEMPKLEQKALELCRGSILDVGCGSGSHSLWLQDKGHEVKAIDSSKGAIQVALKRGVTHAKQLSLLEESETFDTILLLMNGTGIFQTLDHTPQYLKHLRSLLKPNGQVLIDSSDIKYMYAEEVEDNVETETSNVLNKGRYYGELDYSLSYKGEQEETMTWLYLDFETLCTQANKAGLNCELLLRGSHFNYLARLKHTTL